MRKLTTILTACSLAFAVSLHAAKPEEEAAAAKKPASKSKPVAQKQQFAPKQQHAAPPTHVQTMRTQGPNNPVHANVNNNVSKKQARTMPPVQSSKAPTVQSKKIQTNKPPLQTNQQQIQTKKQPNLPATTQPLQTNTQQQVQTKKLNQQALKNIQSQHANFKAQPNTAIASAQFNPNYRIQTAQNLNGAQYNAFRSYQPQWHDQNYWRSRYSNNLSLIGGGWYYWDNDYWYPAWGYDEAAAYYPYDGPIYVGPRARPFDQVVADVQAVLQEEGYYHGEVDGLVGPLTRDALAAYQAAQGLPPTAAIDQPTLQSLGLG
jgi:hypothetical protein